MSERYELMRVPVEQDRAVALRELARAEVVDPSQYEPSSFDRLTDTAPATEGWTDAPLVPLEFGDHQPVEPRRRPAWILVAASAAAIVVGALMFDVANDGAQPRVPADQPATVVSSTPATPATTATPPTTAAPDTSADQTTRAPSSYVQVGESFMAAWVARDGRAQDAMIEDKDRANVSIGSVAAPLIRDKAALPALNAWFRVLGWEFHHESCTYEPGLAPAEIPDSASVSCDYTYENDLTRAAGRDPVQGHFRFIVVGDHISGLSTDMFDADAEIWLAFNDWVSRQHPEDVPDMYDMYNSSTSTPRLESASIALWQRHVGEFVLSPESALQPSTTPPTRAQFGAQARAACAAAAESVDDDHVRYSQDWLAQASQEAMAQLRSLPRPDEDRAKIDQLFMLLEQINERVVANDWLHRGEFYDLQDEKDVLGGRDFYACPVGPLGG